MANKKQNRYKVNIGVSYEKEVYVEADNSYDAIHTVKNILLKSNLFKFYPKDIYSILMESNIDDVGKKTIVVNLMQTDYKTENMMLK